MTVASKTDLRRQFRQVRCAVMPHVQEAMATMAQQVLPGLVSPHKRLGLYWPIGAEPDLRPVAEMLPCALPVVESEQLLYRPWQVGQPLVPDGCGIPAPGKGAALDPSALAALVVPALALDARGIRLGSGGGWYDRLRAQPPWRAVPALAVLPSTCLAEALSSDPWDVPFDGWLDEQGLHWI